MLNIIFTNQELENKDAVAVLIDEQLKIDSSLMRLDQQYHGIITKTLQEKIIFAGKFGQTRVLTTTAKNGEIKHLILTGIGDEKKLNQPSSIEEIGGKILAASIQCKIKTVGVITPGTISNFNQNNIAALLASGMLLASYKFDKYHTKLTEEEKFAVENVEVLTDDKEATEAIFLEKKAIAKGVFLARDCISEPANVLFPEAYAAIIVEKLEPLGIEVEVLGEREMRNLHMGALLGVGQGSANESQLVVMKYNGSSKDIAPIALVGKGVTFDTGGISLKPSTNMGDMKYDMAGSAAVVGAIKALALRKAKVNVVGVIGLVENMPGGNAQRPGDVVTTMSGQTAEVLDTDAEGRLVLADAIWYAQDKFKPECVIDLATLTGAIVVCLGHTYAGCYANDDKLAEQLINAGHKVNEKLWRMPLHKDYDEMIKSDIADVANLGNVRGAAGASTAAHFIARFVQEGVKWVHLDIAGMAWEKKGTAICPKGAVGYGVRLLDQFVRDNYEEQGQ